MAITAVIFGSIVALLFVLIFFAAGYVLWSLFAMKIFQKAGVQGAWRAWVPIYSQMIFFKLGDVNPFLFLFVLIGWIDVIGYIANIFVWVMGCLAAYRIGLKLQKDDWWVVLFAIPPVTFVWLGILALDGSRWNAAVPPAPWAGVGFFADRMAWDGVPAQSAAAAPGAAYGQPGAAYGQPGAGYGQPGAQGGGYGQPHPPTQAYPAASPYPSDPHAPAGPPAGSDPSLPPRPPAGPPTGPQVPDEPPVPHAPQQPAHEPPMPPEEPPPGPQEPPRNPPL